MARKTKEGGWKCPYCELPLGLVYVNEKIDLEIDGDQHYLDQRIVEHDKARNQKVKQAGFEVVRISWSYFKNLSMKEKTAFLINLKMKLL